MSLASSHKRLSHYILKKKRRDNRCIFSLTSAAHHTAYGGRRPDSKASYSSRRLSSCPMPNLFHITFVPVPGTSGAWGRCPCRRPCGGPPPHPAVPASAVDVDVDVAVTGCFAPSGFRKPLVTACRNQGAWSSRRKGECGPWEKNLFSGRNPSAAPWSPRSEPKQRNEDPSAKVSPES